jgi:hypothetical protein
LKRVAEVRAKLFCIKGLRPRLVAAVVSPIRSPWCKTLGSRAADVVVRVLCRIGHSGSLIYKRPLYQVAARFQGKFVTGVAVRADEFVVWASPTNPCVDVVLAIWWAVPTLLHCPSSPASPPTPANDTARIGRA